MTGATAIGGPLKLIDLTKPDVASSKMPPVMAMYQAPSVEKAAHYSIPVAHLRLSATVFRGDDGWIAQCIELGSIGYGANVTVALEELREAVRDYLEIIKDKELAPEIAEHGGYVALLDMPDDSWFAVIKT